MAWSYFYWPRHDGGGGDLLVEWVPDEDGADDFDDDGFLMMFMYILWWSVCMYNTKVKKVTLPYSKDFVISPVYRH